MTAGIHEYFEKQHRRLLLDFENIRAQFDDSDVKGGKNEQTVAEFIERHVPCQFTLTNVEIIDSYGAASDETDVCVCNEHQPFGESATQIVIAEGVDLVIQVKARLDKQEINRAATNCKRIKALKRRFLPHDRVIAAPGDRPHHLERIPYFLFAYSCATSFATIVKNLVEEMDKVAPEDQIDAVFLVGEGAIINFRDGTGSTVTDNQGNNLNGFVPIITEQGALFQMIKQACIITPYVARAKKSPLVFYLASLTYTTEKMNINGSDITALREDVTGTFLEPGFIV